MVPKWERHPLIREEIPALPASNQGVFMKRFCAVISLVVLVVIWVSAAPAQNAATAPAFLVSVANARFVYVASYDGDQYDSSLIPEDRAAIEAVQKAIQQWGKLILVYYPSQADIILLVSSRPTEDVLAVYDAHRPGGNFLWRAMAYKGLQAGETPLATQFETAFESVQHR